jgi:DNA-binding NarL/FixJ family response regulator
VLVVDDHPAVRTGITALVDAEGDLRTVGTTGDPAVVTVLAGATHPDVVILDHDLAGTDGLVLCRALQRAQRPPAVLLYSAFASPAVLVPARIAGACAIVDKTTAPEELMRLVRRAAAGERLLRWAGPELLEAAGQRLRRDDLPLLGMLMHDVPVQEIAAVLGITTPVADRRIDRLLSVLVRGCGPA